MKLPYTIALYGIIAIIFPKNSMFFTKKMQRFALKKASTTLRYLANQSIHEQNQQVKVSRPS